MVPSGARRSVASAWGPRPVSWMSMTLVVAASAPIVATDPPTRWPWKRMLRRMVTGSGACTGFEEAHAARSRQRAIGFRIDRAYARPARRVGRGADAWRCAPLADAARAKIAPRMVVLGGAMPGVRNRGLQPIRWTRRPGTTIL